VTDVSIKSLLRSVNSDRLVVLFRDGLLFILSFSEYGVFRIGIGR